MRFWFINILVFKVSDKSLNVEGILKGDYLFKIKYNR